MSCLRHCLLLHNPYCCLLLLFSHLCACFIRSSVHTSTLHPLHAQHHLCYVNDCYSMYCLWFDLYIFVWCVVQLTWRGIISFIYAWPWSPCICYFWFWGVLLAVLWIYSFPLYFVLHIFGRSFLKDLMHFLPCSANHISHKFWSTRAVEPELKPEAGVWTLGSRSTHTVSGASEFYGQSLIMVSKR